MLLEVSKAALPVVPPHVEAVAVCEHRKVHVTGSDSSDALARQASYNGPRVDVACGGGSEGGNRGSVGVTPGGPLDKRSKSHDLRVLASSWV